MDLDEEGVPGRSNSAPDFHPSHELNASKTKTSSS